MAWRDSRSRFGVNALVVAMLLVERPARREEGDGALGGFVGEELGESQAAVIVDSDVEVFPTGAADMIALAVAGDAMAGAFDARELLDVEVEQFTRERAFVALDGRRWGKFRPAETMAVEQARDGRLGELGGAGDLEARQLAAAQGEDPSHPQRVGGSGGTFGARTTLVEPRKAFGAETSQPLVGAALRDPEARRDLRDRLVEIDDAVDHLGSTHRGEFGLTVTVHAAVVLGWC